MSAEEGEAMREPTARQIAEQDDLGLSIDMLDSDRLRQWADNIEVHGGDVTYWASMLFLVTKLRELSSSVEQAVRDIGTLRDQRATLTADLAQARQENADLQHRLMKLTDYAIPMYQNLVGYLRRSRAEALQARDAALAEAAEMLATARGYSEQSANAARTALLEAAEELERKWPVNAASTWLRARAGEVK